MKQIWTAIMCASFCLTANAAMVKPFNMAYVELNDHQLINVACYERADDHKPFFNFASILAANINGEDPNHPVIYFNWQIDQLLNHTDQVAKLQAKGIKVLLSLLNNHQNAGWSCMTDENSINQFADDIVRMVNKYQLDGIDIDDEYSRCNTNNTSLIRIAAAIKNHPGFKGKILSKALFEDYYYFAAEYHGHKLADYLDYGWEMSYFYSDYEARMHTYLGYGMTPEKLALGLDTAMGPNTQTAVNFIKKKSVWHDELQC